MHIISEMQIVSLVLKHYCTDESVKQNVFLIKQRVLTEWITPLF